MLMPHHALDRKKYHRGGHNWWGGLFMKQLKKWVKAIFLLGCYGCIFHGTGNSAQLCQKFGISGGGVGGGWPPPGMPLITGSWYHSEESEMAKGNVTECVNVGAAT